jgi:virulence factor Mce-like protein
VRRVLVLLALTAAAGGFLVLAGGAGDDLGENEYRVEFDNAFGLIEGGDLKIAGVRAGKLTELKLDKRTKRALVGFRIDETGFGSLRADATCEILPQSLVGEYFVDCQPGVSKKVLPAGSTIPVERTTSTIPPDLVNNIMRRPYREKFSFILNELGAAVAGNAENLNAALRRASPALRQTNKVLKILADQNEVLADLATNADQVLDDLAENRTGVTRFVTEARETAQISASRDRDLAAQFRRFPGFLRELRPTMAELGRTVDQQAPALRNFAASADELERLFENLQPFSDASRDALDSLERSSDAGRQAVRSATPTVAELNRYSAGVPELGRNLAITLEHLDNRDFSAEEDPRSPGGKGYTGLEALLTYTFDQTLSTNVHDGEVHFLKVFGFEGQCAAYADIARAKEVGEECSTALGPNQVGITFPDVTAPAGYDGEDRGPESQDDDPQPRPTRSARDGGRRGSGDRRGGGDGGRALDVPKLDDMLPGAPAPKQEGPGSTPQLPAAPKLPDAPEAPAAPRVDPSPVRRLPDVSLSARNRRDEAQIRLMDYLFGS